MDRNDMREQFEKAIDVMLASKRADNKAFLSIVEYKNRISDLKRSKINLQTAGSKRSTKDYRLVRKYDVLTIDGKERLIKPVDGEAQNILYYVTNEELFDILHTTHSLVGHGGRDRMISELKTKYCNITKEAVTMYLRLCVHCPKKSNFPKKGVVLKPILHSVFNSRAQVDLIDMQSQEYNEYRFIMVYQDHWTKFIILRALRTKSTEEIATNLLDIYTTFGAPAILDSDTGREFVSSVLTSLHAMWDDVKIVHGKPRQSEDSTEKVNRDIEEMLSAWMEANQRKDWPMGLKLIQFHKNRTLNSGIGRTPYETMFGYPPRIGLLSVGVPHDEINNISKEEDIEALNDSGIADPDADPHIENEQEPEVLLEIYT